MMRTGTGPPLPWAGVGADPEDWEIASGEECDLRMAFGWRERLGGWSERSVWLRVGVIDSVGCANHSSTSGIVQSGSVDAGFCA